VLGHLHSRKKLQIGKNLIASLPPLRNGLLALMFHAHHIGVVTSLQWNRLSFGKVVRVAFMIDFGIRAQTMAGLLRV
jgi:hypothetical protein